ncbi:hypothetical protein KFU94_50865 [Chloroflexi bacterium TSY]|nr:hypothetical protein [Chloroflexi bacterium TSY]
MNKQTTGNLLANFRQQGAIRKRASFFGKQIGASSVERMLDAFASAGLTLSEPSFFGVTLREYASSHQTDRPAPVQRQMIVLPQRSRSDLLLAA